MSVFILCLPPIQLNVNSSTLIGPSYTPLCKIISHSTDYSLNETHSFSRRLKEVTYPIPQPVRSILLIPSPNTRVSISDLNVFVLSTVKICENEQNMHFSFHLVFLSNNYSKDVLLLFFFAFFWENYGLPFLLHRETWKKRSEEKKDPNG